MGVKGLLPALSSVVDAVHVSKFSGKTAGVDACGWLYKGAYSCAADLVLGRETDVYLNYCVQQIKMLQENGVTPVLVFDGAPLPAKAKINEERNRNRAIWRKEVRKAVENGGELRREDVNRALSVTNEMIRRLISVLREMGVAFYVAPYEADAQLAFLNKAKMVDFVISEDSDCIPYGCKTIIFKLSPDGWGSELKRRDLGANEELSFVGWNDEMFLQFCVLSGCDYCSSIKGVGVISAYKYVNTHRTLLKVLGAVENDKRESLPEDYRTTFFSAILTFRHQLVFDPRDSKMKMLNPLTVSETLLPLVDKRLLFLGDMELGNDVITSIARGEMHPSTHESYAWEEASAAYLNEQRKQVKRTPIMASTRSLTSSETGSLMQSDADDDLRECDTVSRSGPERSHKIPTDYHHQYSRGFAEMRFEKPRPSSSSSWGHLNSLLGSSVHIVNFRSPKVSDNFKPLSSLKIPTRRHQSVSGSLESEVRGLENQGVRTHIKRVRNPVNRRRDERGSGFDGEVLCRVSSSRPTFSSLHGSDPNAAIVDLTNESPATLSGTHTQVREENVLEIQSPTLSIKRKYSQLHEDDKPELLPDQLETVKQPRLVRPTPFGCLSEPTFKSPESQCGSARSITVVSPTSPQSASPTPPSCVSYARATFAEAKWDRILADELDSDQEEPSVGGSA